MTGCAFPSSDVLLRSMDPSRMGAARLDKRTKDLTKRLRRGEIAVIDHLDIDRVAAEGLVACAPAAVVNASASISGRYPNLGPEILVAAGIPMLDDVGPDVFGATERRRHRRPRRRPAAASTASSSPRAAARRRDRRAVRWRRPARGCPCSSRLSPATRWSTCVKSVTC